MMDIKYQVFVSSTFQDLELERRVVIEQILNLGHVPVGMEVFQVGDEAQWSYIKRRISECDYYVVIVAERYGSEQDDKSYTQMEYEFAIDRKIPTVAFLLHEESRKSWPQCRIEFEKKDKVNSFRDLCSNKMVKFWKNSDDLGAKVIATLVELIREKPGIGWVRGDSVATTAVLNEIARLSEEKRILQFKVKKYEDESNDFSIPAEFLHLITKPVNIPVIKFTPEFGAEDVTDLNVLYIFLSLKKTFSLGCEVSDLSYEIFLLYNGLTVGREFFHNLLAEFSSWNLIDFTHFGVQEKKRYRLTDYGKRIHSPPPDQAGRGMARCGKPRRASARRSVMKAQASTPRRRQVSRTLMVAA
jgi:hypothetical protein